MEITGTNSALRIAVLMAAGGFVGALVTFKVMQTSNCRVLYLSQNELMELERARIANEKLEDQQLFYGKQADAVKLATELPKQYEARNTSIVYSVDKVMGKNAKSISSEIYKEIIETLESNNKNKEGQTNDNRNK